MNDCIFCKIVSKEISSDIVYEDDFTLAFLDIHPVTKGHTLVIPKEHSSGILDTENAILEKVIVTSKKVGKALLAATKATGLNTGSNNGESAGQDVFHLHFHLIPRFAKKELKAWPHHDSEPKTRAELAMRIKENL
jgi:histidine triad (HIT) family protein